MLRAQAPNNSSSAAQIDAFVAAQEKAMEAAKNRLLAKINDKDRAVPRLRTSADEMRRIVSAIADDRQAFVDEDRLPTIDELLGATIDFVKECERISDRVEKFRKQLTARALRSNEPTAMANLVALERRLKAFAVGRDQFTAGSTWAGRRTDPNGAVQLRLEVTDFTGDHFRGELAQTGNFGRADLMEVRGKLTGNRIAFETTGMIRGRNRKLVFQGYLLSDRIVTDITGTSVDGKRVTGWVSLSR
jgi:hypothetical protein